MQKQPLKEFATGGGARNVWPEDRPCLQMVERFNEFLSVAAGGRAVAEGMLITQGWPQMYIRSSTSFVGWEPPSPHHAVDVPGSVQEVGGDQLSTRTVHTTHDPQLIVRKRRSFFFSKLVRRLGKDGYSRGEGLLSPPRRFSLQVKKHISQLRP